MVTQAEYENKIIKFQSDINSNLYEINFLAKERAGNNLTAQRNLDFEWGARQSKVRTDKINNLQRKNEELKTEMWNFQKRIAQEEQDAQIKAIRIAIADQVRLEQEKIKQSQQSQILMEQVMPEPELLENVNRQIINDKNEKKLPRHAQKNLEKNVNRQIINELPFNYNYLIPIIAIGGYFVLRNE